jgi:hypothetical protein
VRVVGQPAALVGLALLDTGVKRQLCACGCILPAVLNPLQFTGGRFFNPGVVAKRAKVHPCAAVTVLFIYSVEAFACSMTMAVSCGPYAER